MAQAQMRVQLSVKEIYEAVCDGCKVKVRELIKEKITDNMVTQVIGK